MNEKIFRKKSIDKVNSPEDLNSYLRVTNPPIWFVLFAIMVLLVGAVVWGCVAKLETTASGIVMSDGHLNVCYIQEAGAALVKEGTIVHIDDEDYRVSAISKNTIAAKSVLSDYLMEMMGYSEDEQLTALTLEGKIEEGYYPCEVVLESVSPIWFLFNSNATGSVG